MGKFDDSWKKEKILYIREFSIKVDPIFKVHLHSDACKYILNYFVWTL
jgi:hypothetical protein